MAKASTWAVYCSPDRFCVVLPAPHRKLSSLFAEKTDALKWRGRNNWPQQAQAQEVIRVLDVRRR